MKYLSKAFKLKCFQPEYPGLNDIAMRLVDSKGIEHIACKTNMPCYYDLLLDPQDITHTYIQGTYFIKEMMTRIPPHHYEKSIKGNVAALEWLKWVMKKSPYASMFKGARMDRLHTGIPVTIQGHSFPFIYSGLIVHRQAWEDVQAPKIWWKLVNEVGGKWATPFGKKVAFLLSMFNLITNNGDVFASVSVKNHSSFYVSLWNKDNYKRFFKKKALYTDQYVNHKSAGKLASDLWGENHPDSSAPLVHTLDKIQTRFGTYNVINPDRYYDFVKEMLK